MDINNEEQNEIEIDLRELFFHIKRYWYIVVVSILVGVLGAAFYLWKIEVPQYQATAMIYMRDSNTQISVSDLQVNQELSSDYMVILKSRPVLNRIISDLDVDMTYDQLYNSTTISTIDDTRIIKITVTNTNAQIAADLANQLVDRGVDTVEEIESKQPYTVEKAVVDNNKINTSNKKVLLMGMLLGLVASIGGLFIQFMLNDKVRSADDIEKLLGVPVLAGIGENKELAKSNGGRNIMKLGKLETRELIDDSAMNESYKTLRTNLLYTSDLKVISLTSTVANEGKTTTAYYLAKSYAELGKKVLLMDCDLRKGSLKKFFTVKTRVSGISEYVSGQSKDFIYQTDVDGLFVVLSGKKPPNPTELLSNSSFEKMLEALKEEFDLIIIDTPPMGIGADATIIGRNVDGVLMVVRNNFVSKKSVKKVKDDLVRTGSKVIGVVLNRIEKHQSDYYDYYGYY